MLPFLTREIAHHLCNFVDFAFATPKCLADYLIGTSIVEHQAAPISLKRCILHRLALSKIGIPPSEG
jgi:hypothetical protein